MVWNFLDKNLNLSEITYGNNFNPIGAKDDHLRDQKLDLKLFRHTHIDLYSNLSVKQPFQNVSQALIYSFLISIYFFSFHILF